MSEKVRTKDWVTTTVSEVATLVRGITYKKEQAEKSPSQDFKPVLRANNINGTLNFEDLVFVPQNLIASEQVIKAGDIIFAMSSGSKHLVGKSARARFDFNGSYGAFCGLLRAHEHVNKDFLYYVFQNNKFRRLISEVAKGSNINNLKREHILDFEIALPPTNEQYRIVAKIEELFSELDKGIESLKTAQSQLKVYRQALLKHAFEGKLTEKWRAERAVIPAQAGIQPLNDMGSRVRGNDKPLETADALLKRIQQERAERYQQQLAEWQTNGGSKPKAPKPLPPLTAEELAELPELPEGWAYAYLSDLGDLGRGKSKHRPRNDPRLFGGIYPFVQTGEVKAANRIIRQFSQTLSDFGLQQSKLWPTGTLCITIAANIAETAFLGFDGCFPDSVVGFSAFKKIIAPEYVDFFIQAARTRIEAYAPATAQKNINLETLENLVVPYCCSDEQRQILNILEERFSNIDQIELTITTALQQSEALRQSILKKAFSGQLVAQDPHDEPASELLARIKAERAKSPQPPFAKGGRSRSGVGIHMTKES
jgi:type I restriction enzyme S subunit